MMLVGSYPILPVSILSRPFFLSFRLIATVGSFYWLQWPNIPLGYLYIRLRTSVYTCWYVCLHVCTQCKILKPLFRASRGNVGPRVAGFQREINLG